MLHGGGYRGYVYVAYIKLMIIESKLVSGLILKEILVLNRFYLIKKIL